MLASSKLDPSTLKGMYRNQSYSEAIIDRHLLVMKLHLVFRKLYGQRFSLYTRTELSRVGWLLKPLPELYLGAEADGQASYLLEIVEAGLPTWQLRRRLWKHADYADDQWDESSYGAYPNLLLVAVNDRTEQRLLQIIDNVYADFDIYTTTTERLLNAKASNKAIWQTETEMDEYIALGETQG